MAETFVKRWATEKELEMSDVPWLIVNERILRLRKARVGPLWKGKAQKTCPLLM